MDRFSSKFGRTLHTAMSRLAKVIADEWIYTGLFICQSLEDETRTLAPSGLKVSQPRLVVLMLGFVHVLFWYLHRFI